jgi:uracil-DNA glycosylase
MTRSGSRRTLRWLDAHAASLSACRRCDFGDREVLPIVSRPGNPLAMLIGQAPGQTEMLDQRPFAGRAGRTLFRWLARAGFDESRARDVLYIAAITRCYPGPSPTGRGDRVPSVRERALCADWLDRELAELRPALVIPVGRLAIDRMIGPAPLDEVVGREIRVEHPGGSSVAIALPHPSGASSWIHHADHPTLLTKALELLRVRLDELGAVRVRPRSSAADSPFRRPGSKRRIGA